MEIKKKNQKDTIDIQYVINLFKNHWLIIGASVFFALFITLFYNKFSTPVYKVSSSLLIRDEENSYANISENFMEGFGLYTSDNNFQNELQVLRSSMIIGEALNQLDFQISYFYYHRFQETELYKSSPFVIIINHEHPQPINAKFTLKLLDNSSYELKINEDDVFLYNFSTDKIFQKLSHFTVNTIGTFGESMIDNNFDFKIILNKNVNLNEYKSGKFSFIFHDPRSLIKSYQKGLEIEPLDMESSVAVISLASSVPNKARDFLTSLTSTYVLKNLEKKNHMAIKTVEYIDKQLNIISDSLRIAEENLQRFRTSNQVMDISVKSGMVFDQMQELEKEKASLTISLKYFNYIDEYFENNKELAELIAPSAMGINDPLLNNMILELIQLNTERTSLIENNQEKSPYLRTLNIRIDNLRSIIAENIKYGINTTNIALQDINSRIAKLSHEINKLPKTERELFGIERKFNLNDAIYTYLLEKRSEAQIAKASYLPDAEIMEPPDIIGKKSPKSKRNYVLGFMIGLIIPIVYIRFIELTNTKFTNKNELAGMVGYPILGQVYNNNKKVDLVVTSFPKSHIAESFRQLRTNLHYFLSSKEKCVISITSTYAQEGKSFISVNLGVSIATAGFKTIILGFDLRKPKVYERLNIINEIGLSSFLSGQEGFAEILQKTNIENLDFITSGPMPPNPAELIASTKTNDLFSFLSEKYEYVIIDTPPVGLISDAYMLMDKSDLNIFVVRLNRTAKNDVLMTIDEIKEKKIENVCLVANDVPVLKKTKYGYGYYEG